MATRLRGWFGYSPSVIWICLITLRRISWASIGHKGRGWNFDRVHRNGFDPGGPLGRTAGLIEVADKRKVSGGKSPQGHSSADPPPRSRLRGVDEEQSLSVRSPRTALGRAIAYVRPGLGLCGQACNANAHAGLQETERPGLTCSMVTG
ncbi:hypothetical protein GQ53DRAFT_811975 [Thozetella sp. PMI_491]|nr:hypothetical protein GQ53DRAFT_811975 [Thozetella sp. PMI_491]